MPPIAVVTRSGNIDPSALLFTRTRNPRLITVEPAHDEIIHEVTGRASRSSA